MARLYNSRCECNGFGIPFDDSNANTDLIAPWGSTLDIVHGYSMEPGPCERKKTCIDFGAAKSLHCSNMLISDTTGDETEHECEFKLGDSSQTLQPPLASDDLPTPALSLDLGSESGVAVDLALETRSGGGGTGGSGGSDSSSDFGRSVHVLLGS